MKVTLAVVFILSCLTTIFALPAISSKRHDEVEIVPLERHNPFGDQPIVDTGIIGFDGPFSNPFSGLFENLEGIMTRMRQQMETLLKRFPGLQGNGSIEVPDFPISEELPSFPQIGDFELGKGNTTSVTKIIDGHKVVINETEYKKQDDFGGAFFKVRIIDVKPDSSELTTNKDSEDVTTTPTVVKDREPMENSFENEISKSKEVRNFDNIESFEEVDNFAPFQKKYFADKDMESNNIKPIESFEDNSINLKNNVPPIDLSRDIYVNQIMANAGAPINPDAEVFYDTRQLQGRKEVDNFAPFQKNYFAEKNMEWNNIKPIETFEDNSINLKNNVPPIDLSRDIYVNQIMADAGAPINPDAEVFYDTRQLQGRKRFETLNNPR